MEKIDKQLRLEGAVIKAVDLLGSEKKQRFWGPVSAKILSLLPLKWMGCQKRMIPRADGSEFRVCIFDARKPGGKTVGVLWLHGGGYSVAAPETAALSFARQLIAHRNCVLVAPDYTLSVEKPFPAALEDAYTAYLWLMENRASLGIDHKKIAVGGESAGGGLTAGLCMYARDRGAHEIGFQLPLYPMLDDRATGTSKNNNAPAWNTNSNRAAWNIYLNGKAGAEGVSPYAAPARQTELAGLPPAISVVGTAEPFYEETVTFFDRLGKAGVPSVLREYPGAYHGFDMLAPYSTAAKQANRFLLEQFDVFTRLYLETECS